MAKRKKRIKRQTMIYKTLRKVDLETRTLIKIRGELRCFGRVSSSCTTRDTHLDTVNARNIMILKSGWTRVCVKNTNNINKTYKAPFITNENKDNRTSFSCGNRIVHHNTELNTWINIIWQNEQQETH